MKILRVTKREIPDNEVQYLSTHGLYMVAIKPSYISAMTAMKIANNAEKYAADIIMIENQKDAIAAISSKKISKRKDYKIVYDVRANTEIQAHIHKEITKSLDGWIFASKRLYDLYPKECKNKKVLGQTSYSTIPKATPDQEELKNTISWIGYIENADMLKACINAVSENPEQIKLRICGSGKARDVMPIVRYVRSLPNPEKIIWLGEGYDKTEEMKNCNAAVRTNLDLTELEIQLILSGRAVLKNSEIAKYIENPESPAIDEGMTPMGYTRNVYEYLSNL